MKRMIFYLFVFFVTPLKCFGEEVLFLSEIQSKALSIAFEHVKSHDNFDLFNTMIIESNEDIRIDFYCKSDSRDTRGGGGKQIIYIISKANFEIKSINKGRGK